MYDAINTAWSKMPEDADVTAHLNSDEQYLPDALRGVAAAFEQHPQADIIEATHVFVGTDGHYLCHRRPVKPSRWVSVNVIQLATCSTFHKAVVFRRHGVRFDTRFRIFGDVLFFRDIMNSGVRVCTTPRLITSTFAVTGENLAWRESSIKEREFLNSITPRWALVLFPVFCRYMGLMRRFSNCFYPAPQSISIYLKGEGKRTEETIKTPTCVYRQKCLTGQ